MPNELKPYQGRDVLSAGVKIRSAGDGLSKALNVDPVEYPLDTILHVVLECVVTKHTYEEIKDTSALTLIHDLKAGRATIVDASLVERFLDEQERRIEEATPQKALSFDEDDDEVDGEDGDDGWDDDEDEDEPF